MFRITFINFFELQKNSKQFAFGLFGVNFLFDKLAYLSVTFVLFNFGMNIAIIGKNYITTEERDRIRERTLSQ
jgi:hypothetical protein